jgi:hypothetical protein
MNMFDAKERDGAEKRKPVDEMERTLDNTRCPSGISRGLRALAVGHRASALSIFGLRFP